MNLQKRMRQLFLAAFLGCLCILMPMSAKAETSKDGNYTYKILSDGTIQLTGCTLSGEIVIPEKIDGRKVTSMDRTFYGTWGPTKVTIPKTVTDIDDFGYVFSYCYTLKAIYVDKENPSFCAVNGVLMNKGKTKIYNYPCAKTDSEYYTPSTVTLLCCTSFARCSNLKELYLTSPVTSWYTYAFWGNSQLTVYYEPDSYSERRARDFIESGLSYESDPYFNHYAAKIDLPAITPKLSNVQGGVKVTWTAYSGASTYTIYRKTSSGSWKNMAGVDASQTSYTDSQVNSGTTYYYQVVAYDKNGRKLTDRGDTGKSIRHLAAVVAADMKYANLASGLKISWKKIPGAEGYAVYRKASTASSYTKIATVSDGSVVEYKDTKAVNGTKYTYRVRAVRGSTMSGYSGKTAVRLSSITFSSLTKTASGKMKAVWTKNSKATGYQIRYSTGSSFASGTYKTVTVDSVDTLNKTIGSLTAGKKYYVKVRCYKTVSGVKYYSGFSSAKSVTV